MALLVKPLGGGFTRRETSAGFMTPMFRGVGKCRGRHATEAMDGDLPMKVVTREKDADATVRAGSGHIHP